jgi:hypothetical protein
LKTYLERIIDPNFRFHFSLEEKNLLVSAISLEEVQSQINEDPERAMCELKGIWKDLMKDPLWSKLVLPGGHKDFMDLMVDLNEIGL